MHESQNVFFHLRSLESSILEENIMCAPFVVEPQQQKISVLTRKTQIGESKCKNKAPFELLEKAH